MFPLNSKEAYINDNGTRTTLGAAIGSGGGGGGTSELPEYGIADAGKVLTVNNSGSLEWGTVSGSSRYIASLNQPYVYPTHSVAPFVEGGN